MVETVGSGPVPRAEQCAEMLSDAILAGDFQPGEHLDEVALGERLGVSRNTLREAFRLLAHDRLVEHLPNRGVFVRSVDEHEARWVYAVRRHLELGALEELSAASGTPHESAVALQAVLDAVADGERGRDEDDWQRVGTANANFHVALVSLAGNPVAARMVRSLLAQTRLRFLTVGSARRVHEAFLDDNRRIAELLRAGQVARARAALEVYLLRAENNLS